MLCYFLFPSSPSAVSDSHGISHITWKPGRSRDLTHRTGLKSTPWGKHLFQEHHTFFFSINGERGNIADKFKDPYGCAPSKGAWRKFSGGMAKPQTPVSQLSIFLTLSRSCSLSQHAASDHILPFKSIQPLIKILAGLSLAFFCHKQALYHQQPKLL